MIRGRLALSRIRLAQVWVLATLAATLPLNTCTPTAIVDLGWTLSSGAWMARNGRLLAADPFTTAPKLEPFVDQQWLAQVLFFGLDAAGGLALVIAATAAASTAAYALALAAAYTRVGRVRVACAAVGAAYLLGFTNLGGRAQTLAYPLFGLFLLAVERRRRGQAGVLWWSLPGVMVVWANVHGSFTLGLLLLGCAAAGVALEQRSVRAARPYGLMLGACGLATLATPFGLDTYRYLAAIGANPILRTYVDEWAPTSVGGLSGGLFFASLGVVGALALRRPGLGPADALTLLTFGTLALLSNRAVAWWGLAIAPLLADLLGRWSTARPAARAVREVPALNAALAATIVLLVALSLPWTKRLNPLLPPRLAPLVREETPQRAGAFLREQRYPGRLFNESVWGGYLDWAVWPAHQPFVDGRIEIYPLAVWQDYIAATYPTPDWQAILDRYEVGYLFLSTAFNAELIGVLESAPGWQATYRDEQAAVFVRR